METTRPVDQAVTLENLPSLQTRLKEYALAKWTVRGLHLSYRMAG